MKYLVLALFLASVAAVEVFYELGRGDAPDAALCTDSASQQAAASSMLLHHLHGHR
jgi:hypothetical protein